MSIKRNNKTIAGTYSATTTASIAPSTDRNYVTDAEKELISNLYFKPAYIITVGTGGDFATISAAIAYVANYSSVRVTINLLNSITEVDNLNFSYMNSSTIIIDGKGFTVTFPAGKSILINYSTNVIVQNATMNVMSNVVISGFSNVLFSNCILTNMIADTTTGNSGILSTSGQVQVAFSNCTLTSYITATTAPLVLSNGTSIKFEGTNTINGTGTPNQVIYAELASIYVIGTLNVNGKSGSTTNSGIYLTQSSVSFGYNAAFKPTNCYTGIYAVSSSRSLCNNYGFTCTPTSVTTLYNPAKNTTGNSNSYIQVP